MTKRIFVVDEEKVVRPDDGDCCDTACCTETKPEEDKDGGCCERAVPERGCC